MTAADQQHAIAVADFYVDLGRRIAEVRTARGMSQHDLAVRIGLTRTGISNVETGRRAVLAHNLVRYASVLAVEPLWLLVGDAVSPAAVGNRTQPLRAEQ